jgi:hypothetical protein
VAKAGDVDASAAEAIKSGSAETAAQRSCAETANPAAEATDCTTAETATTKPAATEPAAAEPASMTTGEPASMTTGEPTPSVTATTSSVTTTDPSVAAAAPSVAAATAATAACKGINRRKGECSTDRGGDGNSDDCFSKHGKSPLWNDLPDRNNLVAATEQRLNVNITIARSGARFAASLCALLIGGVTFDGSTKDAVQCDVRDALVALKAATTQAQAEATKEAQRAGIAHAKANGGTRALQRAEAELQPQAIRERAGDDVTSWISLPPRVRLAIFKLSASSQALFLVRFCCSFLFCLMDEGLGNLGV